MHSSTHKLCKFYLVMVRWYKGNIDMAKRGEKEEKLSRKNLQWT